MKSRLRRLHRYAGLTMLALWLLQAATGVLMVFHWELEDALVAGPDAPLDTVALGRRLTQLAAARPDARVASLFVTGGSHNRLDVFVENAHGLTDVIRMDGAGSIISERPSDHDYLHAGPIAAAVVLHQSLFAGDTGRLFLGVSGLLLLTNLGVGLGLAWPSRGAWRTALRPVLRGPASARLYALHRAFGLWLAVPAIVFVGAGVLQAFDDPLEELLRAAPVLPQIEAATSTRPPIDAGYAIRAALQRFPGSELSGMAMPATDAPWYRVRLRQPTEIRRVFGTTAVYVSAADGVILKTEDPSAASRRRRFLDATYPVHTGEFAGLPGRLLALLSGSVLVTSMVLGGLLWWQRQRRPGKPRPNTHGASS